MPDGRSRIPKFAGMIAILTKIGSGRDYLQQPNNPPRIVGVTGVHDTCIYLPGPRTHNARIPEEG
jgi:hypothetical protein